MMSPHPTLCFSDAFPPHAHSLRGQNSPHDLYLTYNARGALYQLLLSLPKDAGDTVLLPAYHCTALVEPVIRAGYQAVFYRITPDFRIDELDLRNKMSERVALTSVIHFFGFPVELSGVLKMARQHKSYLLEDCAHSFLSRVGNKFVGQQGDFALFSYYKFAPSLAGGGLGVNLRGFVLRNQPVAAFRRESVVIAKRLLEQSALNAPKNLLSEFFLWLEEARVARNKSAAPSSTMTSFASFVDDPYHFRDDLARAAMPAPCRYILESCDWEGIAKSRQNNYRLLSNLVQDGPMLRRVTPDLPDTVVPWAFPVFLENRAAHEQTLRQLGVPLFTFGEILHPALSAFSGRAGKDAEALSRHLLLLPVHAQCNSGDIEAYAGILNRYVEQVGECPRKALEQGDPILQKAFGVAEKDRV